MPGTTTQAHYNFLVSLIELNSRKEKQTKKKKKKNKNKTIVRNGKSLEHNKLSRKLYGNYILFLFKNIKIEKRESFSHQQQFSAVFLLGENEIKNP